MENPTQLCGTTITNSNGHDSNFKTGMSSAILSAWIFWLYHLYRCNAGAEKYGYRTEFHGIGLLNGKRHDPSVGHCTQCCIFARIHSFEENSSSCHQLNTPHRLLWRVEYPYLKEENLSKESIFQELEYFIELLCQAERENNLNTPNGRDDAAIWCTDWPAEDQELEKELPLSQYVTKNYTKVPQHFPLSILWDIPRVKQICRSIEQMIEILSVMGAASYKIQDKEITVHKAFEVHYEDWRTTAWMYKVERKKERKKHKNAMCFISRLVRIVYIQIILVSLFINEWFPD